jgi:hypothetical protein
MTGTTKRVIVSRLLSTFDAAGLKYCVLGDAQRASQDSDGDVDLAVAPEVLRRLPEILGGFCAAHGAALIQCVQHEATATCYWMAWESAASSLETLQLDFCSDYMRRGRAYLRSDELLAAPRRENCSDDGGATVPVPRPAVAFIYYLIKRIEKRDLLQRHCDYLSRQWALDPGGAQREIARFWPSTEARLLVEAARENDWRRVADRVGEYRRAMRKPFPARTAWPRVVKQKLDRVRWPTGLALRIYGAQGSLKEGVIEALCRDGMPWFRLTERGDVRRAPPRLTVTDRVVGPWRAATRRCRTLVAVRRSTLVVSNESQRPPVPPSGRTAGRTRLLGSTPELALLLEGDANAPTQRLIAFAHDRFQPPTESAVLQVQRAHGAGGETSLVHDICVQISRAVAQYMVRRTADRYHVSDPVVDRARQKEDGVPCGY